MTRYVRQRDNYSCGPVAIANALKWAGSKFSYRRYHPMFIAAAKCQKPRGTKRGHFDRTLRFFARTFDWFKVKRALGIKRAGLLSFLRSSDHAAILQYYVKEDKRHFALAIHCEPPFIYLVNHWGRSGPTIDTVDISFLYKGEVNAWLLNKEDK